MLFEYKKIKIIGIDEIFMESRLSRKESEARNSLIIWQKTWELTNNNYK